MNETKQQQATRTGTGPANAQQLLGGDVNVGTPAQLVERAVEHLRQHGPHTAQQLAAALGVPPAVVIGMLRSKHARAAFQQVRERTKGNRLEPACASLWGPR